MKWTNEALQLEALKYNSKIDFIKFSQSAYQIAFSRNMIEQICLHMIRPNKYWTKKVLEEEAKKYNNKNEFKTKNPTAYSLARRHKLLNKICQHMNKVYKTWDYDSVKKEALKYSYRIEFKKKSRSAYNFAISNNYLDKICLHMKSATQVSYMEQQLLEKIKDKYTNAKKYRVNNLKIKDKPYIKSFEIDIYIPELNKGIEFDGNYWHKPEVMQTRRKNWPIEDIKNYHFIKDEYFITQGIQILHIKEIDWINNQEQVIETCFNFLKK